MSKHYDSKKFQRLLVESLLWMGILVSTAVPAGICLFPKNFNALIASLLQREMFALTDRQRSFTASVAMACVAGLFLLTSSGKLLSKNLKFAYREYHYLTIPSTRLTLHLVGFVAVASAITGGLISVLDFCLRNFLIQSIFNLVIGNA